MTPPSRRRLRRHIDALRAAHDSVCAELLSYGQHDAAVQVARAKDDLEGLLIGVVARLDGERTMRAPQPVAVVRHVFRIDVEGEA